MIKTSFILFVLFYLVSAHSQQTIDKLNSNQLKLPKETISKALSIDATGQVKSSATSSTELGYLSGVSSSVQDQIDDKANDVDAVHLTGDESVSGVKTLTGKLVTSSTVNASIPCPVMTQTQRDAIVSPVTGDCVFNSNTSLSNIYDGSLWKAMGGSGGGIGLWVTANGYAVDDVVIESNNIYICLTAHTSGTFASDLASLYWLRLSTDVTGATGLLPLATGGTNKSITPVDGSIVYSDADSFELLSGTSGQTLQSNGSAAPSFVNKSISAKAQNGSSVTAEEIQFPNNLLTQTATNKHLIESGNKNILSNPSFEHATYSTSWNATGTSTFSSESSVVVDGLKSFKISSTAQSFDVYQVSTNYAAQFADGVQCIATARIKSTHSGTFEIYPMVAGVAKTSSTITVSSNGKWNLYKIPFICGASNNGIEFAGTSGTGTVFIDDVFVGAVDLKQDIPVQATQSMVGSTGTVAAAAAFKPTINTSKGSGLFSYNIATGDFSVLKASMISLSLQCDAASGLVCAPQWVKNGVLSKGYQVSENGLGQPATVNWVTYADVGDSFRATLIFGGAGAAQVEVTATEIVNTSVYTSNNANYSPRAFTPTVAYATGGATNVTWTGFESRNGNRLIVDIKGSFSGLSAAFAVPRFTLPNGLLVDAAKLPTGINNFKVIGYGAAEDQAINNVAVIPTYAGTPSFIQVESVTNALPFVFNTNDTVTIHYEVPILGWENSNIIVGSFADLNYVAARGAQNSSQSIPNATSTTVTYNIETYDTHNALSAAGIFTAPISGFYQVSGSVRSNATTGIAGNLLTLLIYKNGSQYSAYNQNKLAATNVSSNGIISATLYLLAGETTQMLVNQDTGAALSIIADQNYTTFTVTRIPGQL
jgi:hypothetical protein